MAEKLITDVTTGTIAGTGAFDKLMAAVTAQLESQFSAGRLTGVNYANVYLGAIQSTIAQSVQFVLGVAPSDAQALKAAAEITLLGQKKLTEEAQVKNVLSDATIVFRPVDGEVDAEGFGVLGKQQFLYKMQSDGFLRDAEQKLTKILMDSWAIAKSVDTSGLVTLPTNSNQITLVKVIEKAREGIGAPTPSVPAVPTTVTATSGSLSVALTWDAMTGATSYRIYWNTTGNVTTLDSELNPGITSALTHTGLVAATKYYYRILSINAGGASELCAEVSATATA
jgi:hypothetical protein